MSSEWPVEPIARDQLLTDLEASHECSLDDAGCELLIGVLTEHLRTTSETWRFVSSRHGPQVEFACDDGAAVYLGLPRTAEACALVSPEDWPQIVAGRIESAVGAADRGVAEQTWEQAQSLLKLRIYLADAPMITMATSDLIATRPAPGIVSAVVLDRPETATIVTTDDVDQWRIEPLDVFTTASLNTMRHESTRVERPSPGVTALWGEYAAAHFEFLPRAGTKDGNRMPSKAGVLSAMPHRGVLASAYVDDMDDDDLSVLARFAGLENEPLDPDPISSDLFWQRPGRDAFAIPVGLEEQAGESRMQLPSDLEKALGRKAKRRFWRR